MIENTTDVSAKLNSTLHPSYKQAAAELGRRGGLKGGKARAEKLSPERRSEIAKLAARKRWHGIIPSSSKIHTITKTETNYFMQLAEACRVAETVVKNESLKEHLREAKLIFIGFAETEGEASR